MTSAGRHEKATRACPSPQLARDLLVPQTSNRSAAACKPELPRALRGDRAGCIQTRDPLWCSLKRLPSDLPEGQNIRASTETPPTSPDQGLWPDRSRVAK